MMGEGLGKAFGFLFIFAVIGFIGVLGGVAYGLYKLVAWLI